MPLVRACPVRFFCWKKANVQSDLGTLEPDWIVNGPAKRVGEHVQSWMKTQSPHIEFSTFEKDGGFVHLSFYSHTLGLVDGKHFVAKAVYLCRRPKLLTG